MWQYLIWQGSLELSQPFLNVLSWRTIFCSLLAGFVNTVFGGEEAALLLMYGHVAFVHNFALENFMVFELQETRLVGCGPTKWKILGLIPAQGTGLGFRFRPQWGRVQEAASQCFSLTSMFLSFSFYASFSLLKKIFFKRETAVSIDSEKAVVCAPGGALSRETKLARTLILDS